MILLSHQRPPATTGAPKMARRSNIQPLTLDDAASVSSASADHDRNRPYGLDSPKTPVTPKSPTSPRSPFRFTTKRPQWEGEKSPMQATASTTTLPPSHTSSSLLNLQAPAAADEKSDSGQPVRGFFGNYKATKSTSRLQSDNTRPANGDSMSRDVEHPVMMRKGSAQEPARSGTTLSFIFQFPHLTNTT